MPNIKAALIFPNGTDIKVIYANKIYGLIDIDGVRYFVNFTDDKMLFDHGSDPESLLNIYDLSKPEERYPDVLVENDIYVVHPEGAPQLLKWYVDLYKHVGGSNSKKIFYFWKTIPSYYEAMIAQSELVLTRESLMADGKFPHNFLFGKMPPNSLDDLLELKEGRVPEHMKNPKL